MGINVLIQHTSVSVTVGTGCHYDNLRCHQGRQSWYLDNCPFSVLIPNLSNGGQFGLWFCHFFKTREQAFVLVTVFLRYRCYDRVLYDRLKTVICNDANFVVHGGIGFCRYDNLRCHKWRQIWQMTTLAFSTQRRVLSKLFQLTRTIVHHSFTLT